MTLNRRALLAGIAPLATLRALAPASRGRKPLGGAFPIMARPYTLSGEVDYEDLANEVEFMERCGVQGRTCPEGSGGRLAQARKRVRGKGRSPFPRLITVETRPVSQWGTERCWP